jgi:hypothetical protein
MPNWKKLIVSGSDASLNNLTVNNTVTATAFSGDGSALTNITAQVTETATAVETFTNVTSKTVNHNFGTKNVIATVYNDSDQQIIPSTVTTNDENNITFTFDNSTSGRIVVAKGGHLVSGSIELFTVRESISGASTYTITHNLNEDYPIVQVYDTNKNQAIPASITSSNSNNVSLVFDNAFTGTVVVKK